MLSANLQILFFVRKALERALDDCKRQEFNSEYIWAELCSKLNNMKAISQANKTQTRYDKAKTKIMIEKALPSKKTSVDYTLLSLEIRNKLQNLPKAIDFK